MPVHNADIAALFDEIADRLEIQGANPFRIRAYRNASRTLGELPQVARVLVAQVALPRGEKFDAIAARMERLCAELGTTLECQADRLVYAPRP